MLVREFSSFSFPRRVFHIASSFRMLPKKVGNKNRSRTKRQTTSQKKTTDSHFLFHPQSRTNQRRPPHTNTDSSQHLPRRGSRNPSSNRIVSKPTNPNDTKQVERQEPLRNRDSFPSPNCRRHRRAPHPTGPDENPRPLVPTSFHLASPRPLIEEPQKTG